MSSFAQKNHRLICLLLLLLSMRALAQAPSGEIEAHGRAAQQYLREQRPDLAVQELEAILALDPNNVNAHANLGLLLFFGGQYHEASTHLRAALSLDPTLWDLRALLGMSSRRLGRESEGRADLEAAFPHVQNPRIKTQAGRELIESYSASGDLTKAKAMRSELQTMRQTAGGPEQSPPRTGYVGSAVCLPCHQAQGRTYVHTAHFATSQLPPKHFAASQPLVISPQLSFRIEEKDGATYQTAIASPSQSESERMDIVIGSGVRGQTYLTWDGDSLYELPLSYWTSPPRWINSPSYQDGTADFARLVHPRCLECHVTYLKPLSNDPNTNRYDKSTLSPGIACEVCHGPGANHVARMKTHSSGDLAILNPAKLSPHSQLELCALCHNGGQGNDRTPAFTYLPGDPLSQHIEAEHAARSASDLPDVHGNQVALLEKSKCFRSSPNMTCSTCHDVHAPERVAASYSAKCLNCHQWQACGEAKKLGQAIARDCIGCHMPVQPTNTVVSKTAGQEIRASMRNHWIKIYRETPPK